MRSEEMLAVRVIQVAGNHAGASNGDVVNLVWMQEDGVLNLTAETDRVVQFYQLVALGSHLASYTRWLGLLLGRKLLVDCLHFNLNSKI